MAFVLQSHNLSFLTEKMYRLIFYLFIIMKKLFQLSKFMKESIFAVWCVVKQITNMAVYFYFLLFFINIYFCCCSSKLFTAICHLHLNGWGYIPYYADIFCFFKIFNFAFVCFCPLCKIMSVFVFLNFQLKIL